MIKRWTADPMISSLAVAVSVGLVAEVVWTQDYKPVDCEGPKPYEGRALYGKRIDLPQDHALVDRPFARDLTARLDQATDEAVRLAKATHMSVAVASADGRWSAARSSGTGIQPRRYYWASIGKVFTGVVIMQLVEKDSLKLTDPISRWVSGIPHGDFITVDHLLLHTSGLFSANEDPRFRSSPRYLTPQESLRISLDHGAMFCPGQHWRYSNTGYSVLGQIIEAVEGRPYYEVVNERIAKRLGLATLRALAPEQSPSDVAPILPADGSKPAIAPSWPFAAGVIVGSSEEMLEFWHAFLTSKLLKAETTSLMYAQLFPMFNAGTWYGRGVMLYEVPQRDGAVSLWLGHSGGTPGAKAFVGYSLLKRAFVAVALSGDGSAEACANLLLRQLPEPKSTAQ